MNSSNSRRVATADPPKMLGGVHSVKQGKVDSMNGRRGVVVSLDVEEFERTSAIFSFERTPGDDGPGELVQSFDEGMMWNVRWTRTGVCVYVYAFVSMVRVLRSTVVDGCFKFERVCAVCVCPIMHL